MVQIRTTSLTPESVYLKKFLKALNNIQFKMLN